MEKDYSNLDTDYFNGIQIGDVYIRDKNKDIPGIHVSLWAQDIMFKITSINKNKWDSIEGVIIAPLNLCSKNFTCPIYILRRHFTKL